jgi:hypothetical protein
MDQILEADYSAATNVDELFGNLSSQDIKRLYGQNESFRKKYDEYDQRIPQQTQTLAPSPEEAIAEADAASVAEEERLAAEQTDAEKLQEQADKLAAEAAAASVVPTVPVGSVEELYDGIEKIGEGSYKLTVDPEDGTPAEIFYGVSQRDCFKAMKKSKANATRELRRRRKKIEISNDLKALEVEVITYAPLMQPIVLSADEIYTLTEQMKDPTTVLEATRKLRQASITPEECARENEKIERQRYSDQYNTAITWIQNHSDFYNCPENIKSLQEFMGTLNWAVTIKNLDLAFQKLQEQGVLLERPEEETSSQPFVQPASVVPVTAVVVPAAVPVVPVAVTPVAPAAPSGALPEPAKVLRPGSSSTATMPTRRIDSVAQAPRVVLTAEEYNNMPAAEARRKYNKEPEFKAAFDALVAAGKI